MKSAADHPVLASRMKPYGLNEAAKALGVGAATLHRAVSRNEVPHTRIGSRVLIPASFVTQAILGPNA